MSTPIQSKSPEKKTLTRKGVFDKNCDWIPEEEVKFAYEMAKTHVSWSLKEKYGRQKIERHSAIEQYQAILLGEEIVLRLSESGVSAVELLDWLTGRAEKRLQKAKKEMAEAA